MGPEGLDGSARGRAMLDPAGAPADETLLVGCGDVPSVGAAALRVAMDVREAVGARHRVVFERSPLRPDPLGDERRWSMALVWPRPHLGKDFTHLTLARAGLHLRDGGRVRVVARTKKGAKTLTRDAERLFGNARVVDRGGGWRAFECVRDPAFDGELAEAWVGATYTLEDPRVGSWTSAPGVFSRRELDRGTSALIDASDHLLPATGAPARIVDLGAGVGPLTLWACRRWASARVVGIEPNTIAAACFEHNVEAAGLGGRVDLRAAADLPGPDHAWTGSVDLVVANPPTHADKRAMASMLAPLPGLLAPRGRALFVVSRPEGLARQLHELGATPVVIDAPPYALVHAAFGADPN